ncbi:MAG: DUF362 domain-containing protein [Akkermansiaceae bacterium]|nr:DUF362 domain-containing protein [Verrucomicrobiales bacterium]
MSRNAQIKEKLSRPLALLPAICCLIGQACFAESMAGLTTGPAATRSLVYIAEDQQATEAFQARPERVSAMVHCGITNLAGKATLAEAWLSLISTQDIVGIKVFSDPGPNSGTRPAVVAALIGGLLSAGVPTNHIIIWDKHLIDLRLAGFIKLGERLGVRVAASTDSGYDETNFYETSLIGNLVWGDVEFGRKGDGVGKNSFVSKLVSQQMTKIINVTPLMNHNQAGVAGALFSLALGSVDNTKRFENDATRLASAVPEIYALPILNDRVVLNVVDALICQYEGEERSLLHYTAPLNQLRFSRDPVALDTLSLKELDHQRQRAGVRPVKVNTELYSNAALLELGVNDLKKIQVIEVR